MKRTSKKIHRSKLITFRILFLCLVELSICNKNSFALDPLGSPSSELQQWQHGIGFEYSTSKADIQLINGTSIKSASSYYGNVNPRIFDSSGVEPDVTLNNFEMEKIYASFSYSFWRNWEAFVRLGTAQIDYDNSPFGNPTKSDSDEAPSMGGGLKLTFYEDYNLKIGCILQANWSNSSAKLKTSNQTSSDYVKTDIKEAQIALGAKYIWTDDISFYGGPVYHYITGEFDGEYVATFPYLDDIFIQTSKYNWDIEDTSDIGAYIGTQIELGKSFYVDLEYQKTGNADALSAGIVWKF